jgi:polyisoprenoid-binding protein YceI
VTPYSSLYFGTAELDSPMQPGFYPDAQRVTFGDPEGHPRFFVTFDHRAGTSISGSFTIHDFEYSASHGLQRFSASFTQRSGVEQAALTGTFTYQGVPEPSGLTFFALCSLAFVRLRSAASGAVTRPTTAARRHGRRMVEAQ